MAFIYYLLLLNINTTDCLASIVDVASLVLGKLSNHLNIKDSFFKHDCPSYRDHVRLD